MAISSAFFRLLYLIERAAAYGQGKGYGAASIEQEIKLLQRQLDVVPRLAIDIGGHVGNYTAELRKRNPDLEIHTFEPSPVNVAKLRDRFKSDKSVHVVPFALSDAAGLLTLHSNEAGSALGSLTERRLDHFGIGFGVTESIDAIRFEDYWKTTLGSRPLDLVKIDVEGHELPVLNGFGGALQAARMVQFEFGGCNIDTRTYFQDFWYFFKDKGFALQRITPFGSQPIDRYKEFEETFSATNFIAVNRRHVSA
jgi:FkbM family methyltransferase